LDFAVCLYLCLVESLLVLSLVVCLVMVW
jgi:hypothetical protein